MAGMERGVHPAEDSAWHGATARTPGTGRDQASILKKTNFHWFSPITPSARPRPHHRLRTVRHPKPSHFHEAESSRTETSRALLPPSKCSQRWEGSQGDFKRHFKKLWVQLLPCSTLYHGCPPRSANPGLVLPTASPTALRASLLLSSDITGAQGPVLSEKSNPRRPSV